MQDSTSGVASASAQVAYRRVGSTGWQPLATTHRDGELLARVDSVNAVPGRYEFRATVADHAGNVETVSRRTDGTEMVLDFPLREEPRLTAELGNGGDSQVVGFREEGKAQGRLLDARGMPVAGAQIVVTEKFAAGSLIDERVRTVQTDAKGRYESLLPGGPSRDVSVSYAGSKKHQGDSTGGLDFDVKGDASFETSRRFVRAGNSINFKGRVKHYFARIPPGGKIVEVQARSGKKWITIKQAKGTDERGKVRLRHRFRRFYTERVTFTFRLKVTSEADWPYRGATTSKKRKVTVIPR